METFLKYINLFFEKSQEKYNSWIVNMFFGVGSIDAKFKCSTFDVFSRLKHSNLKMDDPCFFKCSFFFIKGAPFFFKNKKDINIDD